MKTLVLLVFIILTSVIHAQDDIPELITDRPDQTESSSVVPHKSLQIETGFLLENDESEELVKKSFAYNTTLFRYGLLENFELRLGLEYLGQRTDVKNTDLSNTVKRLSPLYTGFKVRISDEQGWKPEMAFLGGLVLPFTAIGNFKPTYTAASMRFSFSHTFSERVSLGYNLGAEWDGFTAEPGFFYSMALGIGMTEKLGMFLESYGLIPEKSESEHMFDAGFTYLLLPNLQFDISGGIGLYNAFDHFISFGLSYRIPR